jgi:hypothetical protein
VIIDRFSIALSVEIERGNELKDIERVGQEGHGIVWERNA